ncbi:MAG TPA: DUF4255 domain-containing protein [Candidatus Dormibacteraeota bacterium]|nr:DUF4255 domain-containing protein [Candidatus Dormibacteraeota bacterium]
MHDLSIVTDALRKVISDALAASPVWGGGPPPYSVNLSSQHPQAPTGGADCELCLYLFHVGPDRNLANSFWSQAAQSGGGTGKQPVAFEPLSLDLWYMLSAQSLQSYVQEQQVLGVAMQALHEHGTIQLATPSPLPGAVTPSEATLVQESPTFDEMSRLWQSLAMPLRTTSQYRVSVIFLTPDKLPPGAPQVTAYNLGSGPSAPVKDASLPRLLATRRTVTFVAPGPVTRAFHQVPASTAPAPPAVTGQTVELAGIMLADTDHLILISYSPSGVATEADVTATWKVAITPPYTTPPANGVPILLRAPGGGGAPKPGRYGVTVSRPSMPGWRAQPVPLNVAPWINPSGGPLLNAVAGLYSLNVRGVSASVATLRVGTVQLKRLPDGSAPAAGEWQRSGNNITFRVLGGTPAGNHQIGLRVGDVEADPAQWAVV